MTADAPINFRGRRLVVFGAGYIGAEVARQGVAYGLRVTALTRNTESARALAAAGVETVVADLATPEWHTMIEGGADFVLNCVSSGGGGAENYHRSYFRGMASMLAWACSGSDKIGTLVYTSSTAVYPQGDGVIVDESMATNRSDDRAKVLVDTEEILTALAKKTSSPSAATRWFILRLAGIYGPGRHHLLDQLRAGATELPGRGDHRLNLAHRNDISAAIWAAFAAPPAVAGEIFNVADEGAATKAEVVAWLSARLGVPPPSFSGKAAENARRAVTPDRVIGSEKIRRLLGWRPAYPTFREGYEGVCPIGYHVKVAGDLRS
jgi:nucleoside-diphosphate-sugar epimerase